MGQYSSRGRKVMTPAAAAAGRALGPPPHCQMASGTPMPLPAVRAGTGETYREGRKRGWDAKGGAGVPPALKAALPPWHGQVPPASFPRPAWPQEGRAHCDAPSTGSGCNRSGVHAPHPYLSWAGGRGAGRRLRLPRRRQRGTNAQAAAPAPPAQQLVLPCEPVRLARRRGLTSASPRERRGPRYQGRAGLGMGGSCFQGCGGEDGWHQAQRSRNYSPTVSS